MSCRGIPTARFHRKIEDQRREIQSLGREIFRSCLRAESKGLRKEDKVKIRRLSIRAGALNTFEVNYLENVISEAQECLGIVGEVDAYIDMGIHRTGLYKLPH